MPLSLGALEKDACRLRAAVRLTKFKCVTFRFFISPYLKTFP
jgi:hypothetical protein